MADITQLSGAYAASWLPWILIPLICYILPFPIFAILFLWIEREGGEDSLMNSELMGREIRQSTTRQDMTLGDVSDA